VLESKMLEQKRARSRHDKILDAALRVFAKKGYRDAAVDDIAVESKTSKGGVYFHFPGKQAIFLELLNRSAERLRRKLEEAMDSKRNRSPEPTRRFSPSSAPSPRTRPWAAFS